MTAWQRGHSTLHCMTAWQRGLNLMCAIYTIYTKGLNAVWLHGRKAWLYCTSMLHDYVTERPVCCMIAWQKGLTLLYAVWLHGREAWPYTVRVRVCCTIAWQKGLYAVWLHGRNAWLYCMLYDCMAERPNSTVRVCCMIAWPENWIKELLTFLGWIEERRGG